MFKLLVIAGIVLLSRTATHTFAEEVVLFGNYAKPPKYYLDGQTPKGILIDIMKYVEKETTYQFDIQLYPWQRAYENATKGKGGIIGLSKTKERLKLFDYSQAMYYDELVLVVLKGREFTFDSLKDLKGKTIGVRLGASYGDDFERGKKEIFEVDEDNHSVLRLRKLLSRRFDAALIGPGKIGLKHIISQDEELTRRQHEFVILPKPFKKDPNYLGFAKSMNQKQTIDQINKVLAKGWKNGEIDKIIAKHTK